MFDFLKNVSVASTKPEKQKSERVYSKQELNPTNGADLRLFKDGRIYPSENLVKEFNLEYNTPGAKGFDIFSTIGWNFYPSEAPSVVFIAAVPKTEPKVDLFGSSKDGKSVLVQGKLAFAEKLIDMLYNTYGLLKGEKSDNPAREIDTLFLNGKYVDLVIDRSNQLVVEDGIYYLPKTKARGEDKGTPVYQRRENLTLHPLGIFNANLTVLEAVEVSEEVNQ